MSAEVTAEPVAFGEGNSASGRARPPWVRPGTVPRPRLVERLGESPAPVVSVVAPAGYGKTTLLAQWVTSADLDSAWVSLDKVDDDPVSFLRHLTSALDAATPGESGFGRLVSPVMSPLPAATSVTLRIGPAMPTNSRPFVLVLDQLDVLTNGECLDAVAAIAADLPPGWRLAVASRTAPALPIARLRADGRLLEIGPGDLAMDEHEAGQLLVADGIEVGATDLTRLVQRSEGWCVGVYLAGLAMRAGGSGVDTAIASRGDDRFLADYLRSEILAPLPAETSSFLTRTSILDQLSGPLCDAVLARTGSGDVLRSLERSNLLLVPLDGHGVSYRYHQLFRDFLAAELVRTEPALVPELHARATAWFTEHRMPECALEHAIAGGDEERAADLLAGLAQPTYAAGRVEVVRRWLAWFEERGLLDRFPHVAFHGAWMEAVFGRPAASERWAAVAERGSPEFTKPDGSSFDSCRAALRAFLAARGLAEMGADARLAVEQLAPGSTLRAAALALDGLAALLMDRRDDADRTLDHAFDVATYLELAPAAAIALALRAAIAIDRQDWTAADNLISAALDVVADAHIEEYVYAVVVFAVAARVAVHRGDVAEARAHVTRTARLRPLITYALPWMAYSLLQLANAYVELADPGGARTVLREIRDILQHRPDLGIVAEHEVELQGRIDLLRQSSVGASSLTAAELRVLPYLATHLSFREIGERLYVSRHTIKSQAVAVYRKLGVSSRSEAIERITETGLLTP